jgi:hypothetical protein
MTMANFLRYPVVRRFVLALLGVAAAVCLAAEPNPVELDEQTLRSAGLGTDDRALLDYFRSRTLSDGDRVNIQKLVRQLGDESYAMREEASLRLVELGAAALPLLRQAVKDPDPEVVRRAEECLRQIAESGTSTAIPAAAARLLATRKPPGAAEVLLAYLASAANDVVADEVRTALAAIAVRAGQPEKVLVEALSSPVPLRRGAAGEALGRAAAALPQVRKLLQDPEPAVRLPVALALAACREKEAVPVLIELLAQLPPAQAWPAEDLLCRLAQEKAPSVSLGNDEASRRKCRDAWAAWWRDHHDQADLGLIAGQPRLLGYTLVVLLDLGIVQELGPGDKPRWQLNGLEFPLDVQYLPGDRILVAEHSGNKVTERDLKGKVLWHKEIEGPLVAQRLPNGNTFIATNHVMVEVDRDGKELYTVTRPEGEMIMKAIKLKNGEIACVTSERRFLRLTTSGKVLSSFAADVRTSGGRLDVLPNGHVLIPHLGTNQVIEYDAEGKPVWEARFEAPIAAVRLPNGHTLVTSLNQKRAVELDRAGNEVWEYAQPTRVTRAFRR